MKKFLMFMMAAVLLLGATSCSSCSGEKKQKEVIVEDVIKADIDYMNNNYDSYVWYESSLILNDYIDEESCDGSVASIENIFQNGFMDTNAAEHLVVMIKHYCELMKVDTISGAWLEDVVLYNDDIKITYKQAFERLMEANCPKPHTKFCVLRNPLGPYSCNPQYIFGNWRDDYILFVDATTGEVRDYNPAFKQPEE